MKIAIIGSRDLTVTAEELARYIPKEATEIVSGGARGIDSCAREYAKERGLKLTEILPDYARYGKGAPLKRNLLIVEYADAVMAFWDGKSRGTRYVIDICEKKHKPITVLNHTEKDEFS